MRIKKKLGRYHENTLIKSSVRHYTFRQTIPLRGKEMSVKAIFTNLLANLCIVGWEQYYTV